MLRLLLAGWRLALAHLVTGVLLCLTIIRTHRGGRVGQFVANSEARRVRELSAAR